ncbi:ganglioside-induced differentiation-associated protein 1-like [Saccoglossus kowalevskii]|uniref:Ganglioside-induced differentiation-associated protein 1-like n=1 Tax=Saccoglossus kowalevskii TaxID=10224 RepID=A0ABM0M8W1_SACKO|nr:PREDICTED: ganglioside-induced differentiation-associated protein 1-like [Saccoglossus kowalevskii]
MSDIVLYHFEPSFFSQRVRMALAEKGLPYTKKTVSIAKGHGISPWYMKLNKKGQVPTLGHGDKIIVESEKIVEYLDETFPDKGERCEYFKRLADQFDNWTVHICVPFYPSVAGASSRKVTFRKPMLQRIWKSRREVLPGKCEQYAAQYPELKDAYYKKKAEFDIMPEQPEVEKMKEVLTTTEDIMTKMEQELGQIEEKHGKDFWLCGERFTVADIYWAVVFYRLEDDALAERFWGKGKRPRIAAYFQRLKARDSYYQSLPSRLVIIAGVLKDKLPVLLGIIVLFIGVVVALSLAM